MVLQRMLEQNEQASLGPVREQAIFVGFFCCMNNMQLVNFILIYLPFFYWVQQCRQLKPPIFLESEQEPCNTNKR